MKFLQVKNTGGDSIWLNVDKIVLISKYQICLDGEDEPAIPITKTEHDRLIKILESNGLMGV